MSAEGILSRIHLRVLGIWVVCAIILPILISTVVSHRINGYRGVTLMSGTTSVHGTSFETALAHPAGTAMQISSNVWIEKKGHYLVLLKGLGRCRLYINEKLVLQKKGKFREITFLDLTRGFLPVRLLIKRNSEDQSPFDFLSSRNFVEAEFISPEQSFTQEISTRMIDVARIGRILAVVARLNLVLILLWILMRIFNVSVNIPSSRPFFWIVLPALLLMLWLRFDGIGYLLQEGLHPDERMYGNMVSQVFAGNMSPNQFWYSTGFFYITSAAERFIIWLAGSEVSQNLVQRCISAIFSWLSCILVYSIGRRLLSEKAAILATLLFGFSFLPIELAHFGIVEPTMVFFFLWSFLALVNLTTNSSAIEFAKAGFIAGVAIAVKQTAAIILIPFLISCVLLFRHDARKGISNTVGWIGGSFIAFFLLSPGTVLHFLRFYKYQIRQLHSLEGQTSTHLFFLNQDLKFGAFALEGLRTALGYPFMIAAAIGGILIWKKWPKSGWLLVPITFVYLLITCSSVTMPEHYVLILCPLMALLASTAIVSIPAPKHSFQILTFAALIFLLLYSPVKEVVLLQHLLHGTDTRRQASEWCYKNLPPSSRIDREIFGPKFLIPMFDSNEIRLFKRPDWERYFRDRGPQYLVVDSLTWDMFLDSKKDFPVEAGWNQFLSSKAQLLKEFRGEKFRLFNPDIRIYKIPQETATPGN